jgi:glycosyltransferase involved in cell wall biosynthesis
VIVAMKIGLLVPSWPPGSSANGIVTYASQIIPALRELGHEVFVLTSRKPQGYGDSYTYELESLGPSPNVLDRAMFRLAPETAFLKRGCLLIASAVKALVERHGLDIFEMEETFGFSVALSRMQLLPVVVRLHGPRFLTGRFDDPNDRVVRNEGRAILNADFVTAPSKAVLEAVRHHYKFDLAACKVIPNPLYGAREEEIWSIESCDVDSLLFVGRFDAVKGGDLVLRAFAGLAESHPTVRLTFVGPDKGIKTCDGRVSSFDEFVRTYLPERCRSRIEFCGEMSRLDVMSLRTRKFATIIASRDESFSYSVLEAMSLGCPLVATDVGAIPEIIKDERNGLLVPSEDVDAMIGAWGRLLKDRALAVRLGRQAWLDCRESYRPGEIATDTLAVYREAIDAFWGRRTGPQ